MALHALTDADVALLTRVIAEHNQQRVNTPSRPSTDSSWSLGEDHQAPETYVARVPNGIPAKTDNSQGETGTGTPVVLGTGTHYTDTPGIAKNAQLFRVVDINGSPELFPVEGLKRDIHNVTGSAITSEYVPVTRAKNGKWLATGGGGGGDPSIRFQVDRAAPLDDDTSAECNAVIATVLDVSCSASGVAIGDEVTIWDPCGCWFSIPIENLETACGLATQMKREGAYGISECSEDDQSTTCYWQVINLCCLEEVAAS